MSSTYPEGFVEQALAKVFSRGDRTVRSVAEDLNVKYYTLKNWMKRESVAKLGVKVIKEKRPQDWGAEEQLVALHESHGLSGEALNAWCREKGLFTHHLTSWKTAFCAEAKGAASGTRDLRILRDENEHLKRELVRKDKALAEAAALLILQKKFRALWEDEVK
jgi:transposase